MHHTIDICQEIAEKLRSPIALSEFMEDERRRGLSSIPKWPDLSLASGLPGIVCFYAAMDRAFPNQKWDDVAHEYIKMAAKECESRGYEDVSLFYGLTGLSFAGYLCTKGSRYQQFLRKIDATLVREIEQTLANIRRQDLAAPYHYNLISGLSGIVAYLMLREQDRWLQKLTDECVDLLLNLLNAKKNIAGTEVPGWYVAPEHQFGDKGGKEYSQGSYMLSTPFGITGCLSTLVLVASHNRNSTKLCNTINEIASWLRQKQVKTSFGYSWPIILPFDEEGSQPVYGDAWSYGRPSVAISLYMASRITQDKNLMAFAEESFTSLFQNGSNWSLLPPTFGSGQAGLLASTYRMAKLTNSHFLMRQVSMLESSLKKAYNPHHPFGFQRIDLIDNKEVQWNDPGLYEGAVGIALALLAADGRLDDFSWDRAFLLS